jgi:hypothetical protein
VRDVMGSAGPPTRRDAAGDVVDESEEVRAERRRRWRAALARQGAATRPLLGATWAVLVTVTTAYPTERTYVEPKNGQERLRQAEKWTSVGPCSKARPPAVAPGGRGQWDVRRDGYQGRGGIEKMH